MKTTSCVLGVFVLALIAPALVVPHATAPSPTPAGDGVELAQPFTDDATATCGLESELSNDFASVAVAGPHCCGSGAGAACRDQCKLQGPGCKGSIGCRAGECVCTCSCP